MPTHWAYNKAVVKLYSVCYFQPLV